MVTRVAALVLLSVVLSACESGSGSEPVSFSVTVSLSATEIGADRVEFEITHPTALTRPIRGLVEASDPTIKFEVADLIPATGYTLKILAYAADNEQICDGTIPFDIVAGLTTLVSTELTCSTSRFTDGETIGVDLTFQLNFCPEIADGGISVEPRTAILTAPVTLDVSATDQDNTPLNYTWTATSGAITDPNSPNTILTCTQVGVYTLTLRVDDGDDACAQLRQFQITCDPDPLCGNGQREVNELCDDGANNNTGEGWCAGPLCRAIQICGDKVVHGTEECDDGGQTANCDPDCTLAFCGDGESR